jgi:hypothetical protein
MTRPVFPIVESLIYWDKNKFSYASRTGAVSDFSNRYSSCLVNRSRTAVIQSTCMRYEEWIFAVMMKWSDRDILMDHTDELMISFIIPDRRHFRSLFECSLMGINVENTCVIGRITSTLLLLPSANEFNDLPRTVFQHFILYTKSQAPLFQISGSVIHKLSESP